jgi:uncharacterized C2H2 Zn-finger protein
MTDKNPTGEDPESNDPSDDWDDDENWDDEDDDRDDEFDEDGSECQQSEYVSPLDAAVDACYGARILGGLADFAPPHAALEYIADKIEQLGQSLSDDKGMALFLEVANIVFPDCSILEHNTFIACYHCPNEVEPVVDEQLLQRFIDWQTRKIELQEFYRCPKCGGPINVERTRRDPERHLPWFHYQHGNDFDVEDDDKPKA